MNHLSGRHSNYFYPEDIKPPKKQKQYIATQKTIRIASSIIFPANREELIKQYGWQNTNRAIRYLRNTKTIYFVNGVYEEAD
jgi:hypothetical protein